MNCRSALSIAVAACTLQGCLSSRVVMRVRADGSGTAVMTLRVNRQAMEEFTRALSDAGGRLGAGEAPNRKPWRLEDALPEPPIGEVVRFLGAPVRLESSKLTTTADGGMRTTTVAFDDVTRLSVPLPPVLDFQMGGGLVGSNYVGGLSAPALIKFAIRPHENGDRLLIVQMPEAPLTPDVAQPSATHEKSDPVLEMLKRTSTGAAVRLFVELDVPLLRTNAPKREGNRTTILDLDISKMLNSPEAEKMLSTTPSPLSLQEMLWAVGDMPGAITPGEREIFLEFEAPPAAAQPPPAAAPAQRAAPDTEVYLAPLSTIGDQIEVGQPVNVSNNPGYDNQPTFTRDGTVILFTSARGGTQTDIYRYDIESKRVTQVTATPESEYSPTVTPDGGLSVVRVEADGTQRLWRFTGDGHDPRVLLESIKPVGYHAWADDKTLALYILGQPGTDQPSTLQLASTAAGKARTVATDIGRSLAAIPGGHTISFVQRQKTGDQVTLTIKELDPVSGSVQMLTPAVEGATEADCAWTPDGTLLMAKADRVYSWRRGQSGWRGVLGSERLGLHGMTRMAVSPDGKWLAIVAGPQ